MFSFLRFLFLFCLLMFTQSTQAEPDFKIPPIQESMKKMYQIQQKDFTFEDKHYRLFIAVPPKTSQKLTVLYTLDGNAQFPMAVNTVNPNKPLPLIVGIGYVSDKAWNKIKIIDAICVSTKNIIQQYCNDFNNANISVSYVSYIKDKNDEEWIHMVSHSSGMSFRPNACKCEVKLSDCIYHYADLIRCRLSDFEIAMNNEEILRIFKKVSITSDLSKYTQYIAIPLYCKSGKLLGIFQIVTKYGYIIETDRDKMRTFITDAIIPFSNMIILADKIYKGLYINPIQINKEV